MSGKLEVATLGAGCFWCVEAVFRELKGIEEVVSGYAGGNLPHPTYEQVCRGTTGHAEAVRITFDPAVISYSEILDVFWRTHDPTTRNRQGHDSGTQYRSVIFYHDDDQKACAERSKKEMDGSGLLPGPIVTEIVPFTNFYKAAEYHQDYYRANPDQPYCQVVIDPKIRRFRKEFQDKLRELSSKDG
ncbi:MAG TPA: peptide-methionine (S)-S-oxide reductase MsrA [Geobacteraceae bacterium]|nr:peptide-methionine (S)-S-oxide reductase MsrA [Geobacteraceae bacterium]